VNNDCPDGSIAEAEAVAGVSILTSTRNLGYAGGCNLGLRQAKGEYLVLLNNDTEVDPNWLAPLIETMERDSTIAAVQPKILNHTYRERFDYSGAAGGELDIFGYPFARGRLFEQCEIDRGQYNTVKDIFWASGAAVLLRKSALDRVGLLEEDFFAHMEEIDLAWRFHLAGYRITAVPESLVYHQTGGTLAAESFRKMVLNHRNNMLMILRNHSFVTLLWLFPLRLLLEGMTIAGSFFTGRPARSLAVLVSFFSLISHWRTIIRGRRLIRSTTPGRERAVLQRMYRGSVALEYFLTGAHAVTELKKSMEPVQQRPHG